MVRSAESNEQQAKIDELKRLITSRTFESLEMLEDAVDACLWGKDDASASLRGSDITTLRGSDQVPHRGSDQVPLRGSDQVSSRDNGVRRQTV